MKSVKTTEDGAPEGQKSLPAEAPAWSLPDGRGLVEFALAAGFLVPQLMGSDSERRDPEVNEAGLPSVPLRTRSK